MLSQTQIEHFIEYGFVKVAGCMDREFCAAQVRRSWDRSGYDPSDRTTWAKPRLHLTNQAQWEVADIAPLAHEAIGQLCGGHERIVTPRWGDGFIINFGIGADLPWQDPSPATPGWHKDGDWFQHFLDSPEQGLLTIVIWQDVASRGGATFIAADSVAPVARLLAANPQGLAPDEFKRPDLAAACRDFREAEGEAGDVYLLHPFLLHASSPNHSGRARFITNPAVSFREPLRLAQPCSPVELSICRALGADRLDFRITGERRGLVPARTMAQAEQDRDEVARLGHRRAQGA